MITLILGAIIAVVIIAGLLAAYRWARPSLASYLPDAHGRTKEEARAIELLPGLTVNHNGLP